MSWFKPKVKRVTLEEIGYPELFVEFKSMNSMSYRETRDLQKKVQEAVKATENNEDVDEVDSMKVLFVELIKDWNIPPMDSNEGDGRVLPLPKEDADVIQDLPLEIITFITSNLSDEQSVPN